MELGVVRSSPDTLASWVEGRTEQLVDLWISLGEAGPTFGSGAEGPPERARARYFQPLARLLVGALRGSADHQAVYLDERARYVDSSLRGRERAALFATVLPAEAERIAELVPEMEPAVVTEALAALHEPLTTFTPSATKVLFIGDCLFVETRAFLLPATRAAGRPAEIQQVYFSARRQLESVNRVITDRVRTLRPDVIGLSLFTFEGVPPFAAAWQKAGAVWGARQALAAVDGLVGLLAETIADIRTVTDAPIAVHTAAGLRPDRIRRRLGAVLPVHSRWQRRFLKDLREKIEQLVAATDNTILVDESALARSLGGVRSAREPAIDPADVPPGYAHSTRFGPLLARHYDDMLRDIELLGTAKAVLVDFDNTLWSGVMGEGRVTQHHDRQRLLRALKDAGVLLVALSKNDPALIRWDEMLLTPDDFVLQKINWQPKPDNVSAAIDELSLAPGAFVLLDDNPVERALVTEHVPGVKALDSTDPGSWESLRRWFDMPSTKQTDEARRRTQMYREAAERRASLSGGHDYAAMMQGLGLRYSVRRAASSDLDRLLELVQRTNQFNTTTIRRSTDEVRDLITSDTHHVYVGTLADRFGDLGVVACAVFDTRRGAVDSFIMSCRAMGFELETALLRAVLVEERGDRAVIGDFRPTDRNGPAADLFARCGFTPSDGGWLLPAAAPLVDAPGWLTRV